MSEKTERKHPQETLDTDKSTNFILREPEPIEVASGYSISVKYDKDGRPVVYVKKYGEVDVRGLRREIERSYPGAAIQGLEKPRLIEVLDKEKETPKKPEPNASAARKDEKRI